MATAKKQTKPVSKKKLSAHEANKRKFARSIANFFALMRF